MYLLQVLLLLGFASGQRKARINWLEPFTQTKFQPTRELLSPAICLRIWWDEEFWARKGYQVAAGKTRASSAVRSILSIRDDGPTIPEGFVRSDRLASQPFLWLSLLPIRRTEGQGS